MRPKHPASQTKGIAMLSVHTRVHKPAPTATAVDSRPTVLITEQQVKLLTAAALAAGAARRPSLLARCITRAKALHVSAPAAGGDHPRYVQKHYSYLESAAMARAMERL
jgi:hypothetical protein